MDYKILKKSDYVTSKWDGGTTTQVYIYPENGNYQERDFLFRISSATIDVEESNFTSLPDFNRFITTLTNSIQLTNNETKLELKPYEIFAFDGGDMTKSVGKTKDFNLMCKKGYYGDMKSMDIEGEVKFSEEDSEERFLFFYTPESLEFVFENETIKLDAEESLIINLKENEEVMCSIKTKSDATTNIIFGTLFIK